MIWFISTRESWQQHVLNSELLIQNSPIVLIYVAIREYKWWKFSIISVSSVSKLFKWIFHPSNEFPLFKTCLNCCYLCKIPINRTGQFPTIIILPTNNRSISVGNVGNCFRAQNHLQWQITNRQKLLALSSLDEGFN